MTREPTEYSNVNPPRSVPSVRLEAVNLVFSLSTCRRIRTKSQGQHGSNQTKHDQKRSQGIRNAEDSLELAWESGQLSTARPSVVNDTPSDDQSHGASLEIGATSTLWNQNRSQSAMTTPFGSQRSDSSIASLNSVRCSSYSSSQDSLHRSYVVQEVKFEHVLRLLNDSLSIAFCDRRPRKSRGVIVSKDTGFPRLDAISPALFSPGYLEVGFPNHDVVYMYRRVIDTE